MRLLWCHTALLVVCIGPPAAAAPTPTGRSLYGPCVVCHQPNAWGSPDGFIPSLAAQQRRYLERQITAFRLGMRVDMAMQLVSAHAKLKGRDNIRAVASYLSALPANPAPVKGSGEQLPLGQETYQHICAACHGPSGQGQAANRVPRIAAQHFPYVRRQIDVAGDLHRDYAPPEMTGAMQSMTDMQRDAVADYVSRLNTDAIPAGSRRAE